MTDDEAVTDTDEGQAADDAADLVVLPWWMNPRNVVALVVAAIVLAGGIGFVVGERNATPDPNATDIGFLQDMRDHHEQGVEMALVFVAKAPGVNPTVRLIAKEIAFGQGVEIGRMIQLLREYGEPEANMTDVAMGWMGEEIPRERMPGLATDADLDRLSRAQGDEATSLFLTLMIAHHEGGLHMAEYARDHAATDEVVKFAISILNSQQSEIGEMQRLLAA